MAPERTRPLLRRTGPVGGNVAAMPAARRFVTRSAGQVDPFRFLSDCAPAPRFLLWHEGGGFAAAGVAEEVSAHGPDRWESVRGQSQARLETYEHERLPNVPPDVGPRWFGGFAFEDDAGSSFSAARFFLPRVQLTVLNGYGYVTELAGEPPHRQAKPETIAGAATASELAWTARPEPAAWTQAVRRALQSIRAGDVEKVVLARRLVARLPRNPDLLRLLASLAHQAPSSRLVLVQFRPDEAWIAATPELLAQVRAHRVRTVAVAGSRPRGRTPEEDESHARALMASSKDGWEHELVCRHIRAILTQTGREWRMPVERGILRLPHVQHLETHFEADAGADDHVLGLASRLHPTPAVSGYPVAPARNLLRTLEGVERGWYAGGIGCFDTAGDGEFHVLLRCAHVRGQDVTLVAGCGIVNGSDPAEEWEESRIKFQLLVNAFQAEAAAR